MLMDEPEAISDVQEWLLEPLQQKLLQTSCSGAFILLNTTVNSSLEHSAYSRTGLYLQKSGIQTSHHQILLYRGIPDIGKHQGIMPHRKWRLEFQTDHFPNYEEIMSLAALPLDTSYRLTDLTLLPGTSEQAVLMTVPIMGKKGEVYGLCGFEVSQSFFKYAYAQPTNLEHLICLLAPVKQNILYADAGLSCGISNGYYVTPKGNLAMEDSDESLIMLSGSTDSYRGIVKEVFLSYADSDFMMAVMLPESDYDRAVLENVLQIVLLTLLLLFFTVSCCLYFSRKFLSPLLKDLEALKDTPGSRNRETNLVEINDLFEYLSMKDTAYEMELQRLQQQQLELMKEYQQAQVKISRMTEKKKREELDTAAYEQFLQYLNTLTPKERDIFQLYLEGKNTQEIQLIANISHNTLKYHNRNIYEKLGVSSRKELLMYASFMKQEDNPNPSTPV